jgi:small subunit ribosomal protein S20
MTLQFGKDSSFRHRDRCHQEWQYASPRNGNSAPSAEQLQHSPSVDEAASRPYKRRFANLDHRVMANTKSAKKAARQIARRTVTNRARRSRLRSAVRKVEEAIVAGDRSRALAAMAEAEPVIIRAAQKDIVHRNAARRKVSRLVHRIAQLGKS